MCKSSPCFLLVILFSACTVKVYTYLGHDCPELIRHLRLHCQQTPFNTLRSCSQRIILWKWTMKSKFEQHFLFQISIILHYLPPNKVLSSLKFEGGMKVQTRIQALLLFQVVLEPDDDEDNTCLGVFLVSADTFVLNPDFLLLSHLGYDTGKYLVWVRCGPSLGAALVSLPDMWPIKAEPDSEVQQWD